MNNYFRVKSARKRHVLAACLSLSIPSLHACDVSAPMSTRPHQINMHVDQISAFTCYTFRVMSAIAEGPHLAHDSVALGTSMLGRLHLVDAARQARREGQADAAEEAHYAKDGRRGAASGVTA